VPLTALAGVLTSCGAARAKVLPKMAGLRLAESTVQRVTEAAGRRLKEERARGRTYGQPAAWDWRPDAAGQRCAYVSLDATGVGQQGPGGTASEGRMAYVGMIFNPRPAAGPGRPRRGTWRACMTSTSWGRTCAGRGRRSGWIRPTAGLR
jgi:hypothetical protein